MTGRALTVALVLAAAASARAAPDARVDTTIGDYYDELERLHLVDIETGTRDALTAELAAAEKLLDAGDPVGAAVALYAIVESPRFRDFAEFVELQNAEYDLAVALAAAGAYESALDYLERVLARGPSSLYYAPAHRRAVDIALETHDYAGVLARIEAIKVNEPIPPGAAGERSYLRARIAYDKGQLASAEGELTKISRRSRLYSSAIYLRGVIQTRRGDFRAASEALCEIAETPDTDKYTFVVDDRYFTIKDLARLGLGRIAHEEARYDDAYYHYFQIPDDSDRLQEALFEAAWSMYQKRELGTARDLVAEFLATFPDSPLAPEAGLLAGYVELADCKFDVAQQKFDALVVDLQPVVDQMAAIRSDPDRKSALFDQALVRWRAARSDPSARAPRARTAGERVLSLLRLDPRFVRLHDAVSGLRHAAGDAPHVVRAWRALGRRMNKRAVAPVAGQPTVEEEDAADSAALLEDVRRLRGEVARARDELRRGARAGTLPADAAAAEEQRLAELDHDIDLLEAKAGALAEEADARLSGAAEGALAAMIKQDLTEARALEGSARELETRLDAAADRSATASLEALYDDTRRVLDKAKLGKIDAVIGQKRVLDIAVQDLASGRYPPELHGRLWEEGLIGDDEEYWPPESEYWKDEYEGWR